MSRKVTRDPSNRNAYAVGYGKPSESSRFKPGVSGNPKGRPRGVGNPGAIVYAILTEKVSVRIGDKVRRISKFEAILQHVATKAMKGDPKSIKVIMDLTLEHGSVVNPPKNDVMKVILVGPDGSQKPGLLPIEWVIFRNFGRDGGV